MKFFYLTFLVIFILNGCGYKGDPKYIDKSNSSVTK